MDLLGTVGQIAGGALGGPIGSAIGGALGGALGGAGGGQQAAQFQQALNMVGMSMAQDMFGEMQEAFGDTDEEE
jgi:hypothetical protein